MFADDRLVERLLGRVAGDEELRLPGSIAARGADEGKVWAQRFAHFRHLRFQSRGQRLAFGDLFWRVSKHCGENVHHPCALTAGSGGVVLPFFVGSAQSLGLGGVARFQSLRENPHQHRQGNKGTGNLDER